MIECGLNGFEVLAIAEQIEKNGTKFYLKAADSVDDTQLGKIFIELANWEKKHLEVLLDMKEGLSQAKWGRGEIVVGRNSISDSQLMAGLAVFAVNIDPAKEIERTHSRREIINLAIQKERDTIVFYSGLKSFLDESGDDEFIENIIREEMRHVRILRQFLD